MRGILTRTAHTHGTREIYVFLLSPPAPIRNKNEENKEDETQERCHLSGRKVLPFSEFAATFLRKRTPIYNPSRQDIYCHTDCTDNTDFLSSFGLLFTITNDNYYNIYNF